MEPVNIHVNVDDGTPRFPLTFRVPLCYSVLRLKEMIESQEGLGITEQTILLNEVELKDRLTLGQQNVEDESFLDLRVNFDEIPSPTRKKGSLSSQHEDCVVPDIDDEDNVFKFDRPKVPSDPRNWEIRDVLEWLRWAANLYNIRNVDFDKFRMNGKGLCMLTRNGFLYRVPNGGELLHEDFQMRLQEASASSSQQRLPMFHPPQNVPFPLSQPEVKFPVQHPNLFPSRHLPVPLLAQPPHMLGPYSPEPRSPFEYSRDPNFLFFQF